MLTNDSISSNDSPRGLGYHALGPMESTPAPTSDFNGLSGGQRDASAWICHWSEQGVLVRNRCSTGTVLYSCRSPNLWANLSNDWH